MARHDEKTSAGRVKMLSGGDTGDRLAEVDEVLGCLVVQTKVMHSDVMVTDNFSGIPVDGVLLRDV